MEWAGFFAAVHAVITNVVNAYVKGPYMDEIFHVPQAQRYCAGEFATYDSKLTTPPALYLYSTVLASIIDRLLPSFFRQKSICAIENLRFMNIVPAVLVPLCILLVLRRLYGEKYGARYWHTLATTTFPWYFFYVHLYYNEALSTCTVIASFLFALYSIERSNINVVWSLCSALAGVISIACRQNNVIWVGFSAAYAVMHATQKPSLRSFIETVRRNMVGCAPWLTVAAMFLLFIVWNGGLVIGDKLSHQPVFHFAQLCYVLGVAGLYLAFDVGVGLLSSLLKAKTSRALQRWDAGFDMLLDSFAPRKAPLMLRLTFFVGFGLAITLLVAVGIHNFTYTHPYLLADNRHYSFYLWNRVLGPYPFIRVSLSAWYILSAVLLAAKLHAAGISRPGYTLLLWTGCAALYVVPSQLLEFRYFAMPIMMALLLMPQEGNLVPALWTFAHVMANVTSIFIFLTKPFIAPDGTEGRFMW